MWRCFSPAQSRRPQAVSTPHHNPVVAQKVQYTVSRKVPLFLTKSLPFVDLGVFLVIDRRNFSIWIKLGLVGLRPRLRSLKAGFRCWFCILPHTGPRRGGECAMPLSYWKCLLCRRAGGCDYPPDVRYRVHNLRDRRAGFPRSSLLAHPQLCLQARCLQGTFCDAARCK